MRITDHSQVAVSVTETGKTWSFLVPLVKLFYGFFCLKMLNSAQMWLVCLLAVRAHFQMFSPRLSVESVDRSGRGDESNIAATSKCILSVLLVVTKEANSMIDINFAGFSLLFVYVLQCT